MTDPRTVGEQAADDYPDFIAQALGLPRWHVAHQLQCADDREAR